ncbi:MAG: hypothetical protein AAGI25_20615 [Bacteroidota bacterium]
MRIECVSDRVNPNIHESWICDWANTKEQLELTIGKIYVVLAVARYSNNFFFYILGDENNDYPLAFPIQLFTIKDFGISKFWDCDLQNIGSIEDLNIKNQEIISFKEWKNQGDKFYEKVLEEDKQSLSLFNSYRDKLLIE